ncbi:PAS domain S-box protein [Litchfieldia alkalitelluris]|uniref:PAS domain S-box protein n=1 Tax=Litchfieldia alkalitelluris TaxID=304268 RepID=UPI000998C2DC|nr:PAS domain S-box protein [Litchfieldia alkalitelluris]
MENQRVNILMVDDRKENLLALEAVLASSNYNLISASSGEEALRWVLKEEFAVILLDVQMPGIDGFETAKLIRARNKSKDIPIIFITALSQTKEHELNGYSVGAIDYLFKPFPPLILKSKVDGFVKIYLSQLKIREQNNLILEHSIQLERAHMKLQRSEALARAITEASIDSLLTINNDGFILTVNPACKKMFGYEESELLHQPLSLLLPSFKATVIDEFENTKLIESYGQRKSRERFPVDFQICSTYVNKGAIYVCSIRDITERKLQFDQLDELVRIRTAELVESHHELKKEVEEKQKMVQLIKESEQRYRSLVENHPDAVYSVDLEGRLVSVNEGSVKLTGRSREELIGTDFMELIPLEDQENSRKVFQAALKGSPNYREMQIIHKDGTFIHIHSTTIPIIIDGRIIGIYGIAKDITLQKDLWQQLYESEEKYRHLVEASPDAIIIQQLHTEEWTFINKTGLNLLGIEQEYKEFYQRSLKQWVHHEDFEMMYKFLKQGIEEKSPSHFEARLIRRDRETIYVQVNCIPFMYMGIPSLHIVINDITELKHSREFIKESEKLTVVGELAAGIAHEIRNPLTSLRGFTQLLQYTASTDNEYVPIMIEEIDRINTIVSELLLLSKPNSIDFFKVNIGKLLDTIVILMNAEANLHNVKIEILKMSQQEFITYGIENKIKQVFVNILKNAIEAMPHGGQITVQMKLEGNLISILFIDQGEGIPAEVLAKIGQPFFTTKEKGTGLGMMVCHNIIDNHHGTMKIDSEIGKGTTVEISLPLYQEAEILTHK